MSKKNSILKRGLSLVLSICVLLCCNIFTIKVKATEIQNVQEKTTIGGQDVVNFAVSLLGKPYKENGTTPEGFDLGGFTMYVYSKSVGITISSRVYDQKYTGAVINYEDIKLGDLVFTDDGSTYGIVGIYVGDDKYIYASKKGVTIEKISNFKLARRIIDDEEQQVLKVNKGETYEITNQSDGVMYLLTDNIDANVEATYYTSNNVVSILSINNWRAIGKDSTVKFTVLEENGLNIYYPSKIQNSIKKLDTPALYTANIEQGKNYELVNNCEEKFSNIFEYEEKFDYVYDDGYSIWSAIDDEFNVYSFRKNDTIKFCKSDEGNLKFKVPYELKDSFKEVSTPIFRNIVLNKDEVLELSGDPNKGMNYFTSATEENGIRYSQVFRGNYDGPWYEVDYSTYGEGRFINKDKIKVESGDKVEILLPYDFNGYKKVKEKPIYYEEEILPGQIYELKNIYQVPREYLVLSTDYLEGVREDTLEGTVFNYNGKKHSMSNYENKVYLRGGDIAQFTTSGDKAIKLYLPLEFKDLLSKVDGPISEEYGYEIEDINKDKSVDSLDLSIVASNYNKRNVMLDKNNNEILDFSFDDRCDFNNDGIIDVYDLVAVAKKF